MIGKKEKEAIERVRDMELSERYVREEREYYLAHGASRFRKRIMDDLIEGWFSVFKCGFEVAEPTKFDANALCARILDMEYEDFKELVRQPRKVKK